MDAVATLGNMALPDESRGWTQVGLGSTILSGDLVTTGAYLAIVAVCAPIWEEVMFRVRYTKRRLAVVLLKAVCLGHRAGGPAGGGIEVLG